MRLRTVIVAWALTFCVVSSRVQGQDAPEVVPEKQWEQAKQKYAEHLEKLKQTVADHFTTFEKKARERGDTAKLKELNNERVAFDERGEFPKYFDRFTYARQKKSAQDELRKAQKALLVEYLKAKRDAEAQELEDELADLIDPPPKQEKEPANDQKNRWVNTSYNTTIYRVKGKQWAEVQNWDHVIRWYLQETGGTREYIELFNLTRKETWRVFSRKVDLKEGDNWKTIAYGRWDEPTKEPTEPVKPQSSR